MSMASIEGQTIEASRNQVSDYVQTILHDSQINDFRRIGERNQRLLVEAIARSLDLYLAGNEREIVKCCDALANRCFQLSVPLLETAYILYLLRDVMAAEAVSNRATEARINKFFDALVLELLQRY